MSVSRLRGSICSYPDLMSQQWERQHSAIATKTDTGKKPCQLAADPDMWHHKGRGVCHVHPPLHSRTISSSQESVQWQGTAVDPNGFVCNTQSQPANLLSHQTQGYPVNLLKELRGEIWTIIELQKELIPTSGKENTEATNTLPHWLTIAHSCKTRRI